MSSAQRRRSMRLRRLLGAIAAVLGVVVAIGVVGFIAVKVGKPAAQRSTATDASTGARRTANRRPGVRGLEVRSRRVGALGEAFQDAAGASTSASGASTGLFAGLSASDVSTNAIRIAEGVAVRTTGSLPRALHDAAAAYVGGADYLFGGGDGVLQHAEIYRVDAARGKCVVSPIFLRRAPTNRQRLSVGLHMLWVGSPAVAGWTRSSRSRRRSRCESLRIFLLPFDAAVTSVGVDLIIAGGSLENGSASRAIYRYAPGGGVS